MLSGFMSLLLLSEAFASPVVVGQALGLSKKSESYQLSEEIIEALSAQYQFEITLIKDNNCADVSCLQKLLTAEEAQWLLSVVVAENKQEASLELFHVDKQKVIRKKTTKANSWEELPSIIKEDMQKMVLKDFAKIPVPAPEKTEEEVSSQTESPSEVPAEETPVETLRFQLPQPFSGVRIRGTGALGIYRYGQSSTEGFAYLSPSVSFLTILPDIRMETDVWIPNIPVGLNAQASIAPFGYKQGDESSMQSISNLSVSVLYRMTHSTMGSWEFGLGYHNTKGMGFQFVDERTKVESISEDITGAILSAGMVGQFSGYDVRVDVAETFAPWPKQTKFRLYAEQPYSVLPFFNSMLTLHGGVQCTLRHFSVHSHDETGKILDVQAGVFGGAGIAF